MAIFGPYSAPSIDQAVAQRVARLAELETTMSEKKREIIQTSNGIAGLKILFEVRKGGQTYLSPHFFFMTGEGEYCVIKTIPKAEKFSENAKAIEDHVLKTIESGHTANSVSLRSSASTTHPTDQTHE